MPGFGASLIRTIGNRELKRVRYMLIAFGALQVVFSALFVSPWIEALVSASNESVGVDEQFVRFLDHASTLAEAGFAIGVVFIACAIAVRRVPRWSTAIALVLHAGFVLAQIAAGTVRWRSPFWIASWFVYASMMAVGLVLAVRLAVVLARSSATVDG